MVDHDEEGNPTYDGADFDVPSPRRPRKWRWLLATVALLVVIALVASLVVTITGRPHVSPINPAHRA